MLSLTGWRVIEEMNIHKLYIVVSHATNVEVIHYICRRCTNLLENFPQIGHVCYMAFRTVTISVVRST
jgi:hypothetical protein